LLKEKPEWGRKTNGRTDPGEKSVAEEKMGTAKGRKVSVQQRRRQRTTGRSDLKGRANI